MAIDENLPVFQGSQLSYPFAQFLLGNQARALEMSLTIFLRRSNIKYRNGGILYQGYRLINVNLRDSTIIKFTYYNKDNNNRKNN
jgi:hypothetical protein